MFKKKQIKLPLAQNGPLKELKPLPVEVQQEPASQLNEQ